MNTREKTVVELEQRFWRSLVEEDADTAVSLLTEPALMVSPMGVMKFDHDRYRQMATQGSMTVQDYQLRDMEVVFPSDDVAVLTYKVRQTLATRGKPGVVTQEMADSSTWVRHDGSWLCAVHTETPMEKASGPH
jgi:ketosteroid isomerase-like protein